jgi:O-antigen/teichoic acid export membrane protein
MMLILKILWTLPQTLFGAMFYLYLIAINKISDRFYWATKNAVTLAVKNYPNLPIGNGISLGEFILMKAWASNFEHELKHYKQQLYFGWLWLPVYLLITGAQMLFGVAYNETLFEK